MSLLDDVSIAVTPNGYKAGRLYGVLPTYAEGIDLVDNGDFATDLSGWNITGNDATHTVTWTASGARFQSDTTSPVMEFKQLNLLTSGKHYVLTCNIAYTGVGQLRVNVGTNLTPFTEGANTKYFTATSSTMSFLRENANVDAIIDNVIVKEVTSSDMDVTRATAATRVDENGLVNYAEVLGSDIIVNGNFESNVNGWTDDSGATITWQTDKTALVATTGDSTFAIKPTPAVIESGKSYKISFRYKPNATGTFRVRGGSTVMFSSTTFTVGDWNYAEFTGTSSGTSLEFGAAGGSIANFYIDDIVVKESDRNNVPRIDYTGGGCPHILAEPERRNLVPYSEDFTSWNQIANITLTQNSTTSPSGESDGTKFLSTSTGAKVRANFSAVSGTTYTFSVYCKNIDATLIKLQGYDGANEFHANLTSEVNTSTWTRISLTFTAANTATGQIQIARDLPDTESAYFWGAQLEEGSYATSYIPNFGTALGVTRNQDIFTRDGIGSLINSTEGVLFIEMAALSDDLTNRVISLNDGTSSNRLMLYFNSLSNTIAVVITSGGSTINYTVSDETSFNKMAVRYRNNDLTLWVDGESRGTPITSATIPTFTALKFDSGSDSSPFFGKVKQLQVYNTALTDEQLLQLTGESGTDFYESYAEMATALTYTIQ